MEEKKTFEEVMEDIKFFDEETYNMLVDPEIPVSDIPVPKSTAVKQVPSDKTQKGGSHEKNR